MRQTLVFIVSDCKMNCTNSILHGNVQKPDPFTENLTDTANSENDIFAKINKALECLEEKLDESGGLTQEDFLVWSVQNNSLIAPLLELLFQVCHVSLGLRPHCRHEEYEIGMYISILLIKILVTCIRCLINKYILLEPLS